jgi:hypothetical protein
MERVCLVVQRGESENFTEPPRRRALVPVPSQPEIDRMRVNRPGRDRPGVPGRRVASRLMLSCPVGACWATRAREQCRNGIKTFTCVFVLQHLREGIKEALTGGHRLLGNFAFRQFLTARCVLIFTSTGVSSVTPVHVLNKVLAPAHALEAAA